MTSGIRRDGHLTDLAIDQILIEHRSFAHAETCDACRRRIVDARAFAETEALPALHVPVRTDLSLPTPANRSWLGLVGWGVAAAAVGLLALSVTTTTPSQTDGIRTKGSAVTLQLFRDEGPGGERLRNGAIVSAGDRIGFRVRHPEEGRLMILGVDGRDEAYLCYPQDNEGLPAEARTRGDAEVLPQAVQLDPTPGTERMIAVVCQETYPFDAMATFVREARVPRDCAMDEVELQKP